MKLVKVGGWRLEAEIVRRTRKEKKKEMKIVMGSEADGRNPRVYCTVHCTVYEV